jgi:hypothetical protein
MCHFLTCSSNPCLTSSLQTLSADICNSDPHPARFLILWGLKHWFSQTDEPFQPDVSSFPAHMQVAIAHALSSQERIGWYQASKGFVSQQWSQLATQDLNHPKSWMRPCWALLACVKLSMRPIAIPLGSGELGMKYYMLQTIQIWRTSDRVSSRKYVQFTGTQNV